MNWQENYKTKDEAYKAILEGIVQSPGCAGVDGTCTIQVLGQFITIRPRKKKEQKYETQPSQS